MPEPQKYVRSDWVDETIDGIQELSGALSDSMGIMQLHFFKAQLDIIDGMRKATQRYVDFLERRYGERDQPMPPDEEAASGRPSRSAPSRSPERLWPPKSSSAPAPGGDGATDDEEQDGAAIGSPVVFGPYDLDPPVR
jgi:hypothetical protein